MKWNLFFLLEENQRPYQIENKSNIAQISHVEGLESQDSPSSENNQQYPIHLVSRKYSLSLDEQCESSSPDHPPTLTNNSTNKEKDRSSNNHNETYANSLKNWVTKRVQYIIQKLSQDNDYIDRSQQGPGLGGMPFPGLRNLGNTCYMNSIVQCLSHTLPLREFYVSGEYCRYLNNRGDLSSAFKRVMRELSDLTSPHPVDPYYLRRQIKAKTDRFPDYRQHDAHEFMRFLLNELHEEINRASVAGRKSPADNETLGEACARHLTWEDSRISELFGGMLRSEVCCSVCSDKSIVYIPFMDITLPIPDRHERSAVSLSDCLAMIRREETLDEEERPYCNRCMDLTRSTKQLFICNLPRYLVIQLKRFSYYPTRTKLTTSVKFDDIWKLKDSSNKSHTYYLYGIVCHSIGEYGGHYIAYCQHNGVWRCFNDSRTGIASWEHVRNREAYVIFYTEH